MSRHIAILPGTEIISPMLQPLLSGFSSHNSNKEQLSYRFELIFLLLILVLMPICSFMWDYSDLILSSFLGQKWAEFGPILGYLSLVLFSFSINQLSHNCCTARGLVKQLFVFDLVTFVLLMVTLYLSSSLSIEDFTLIRALFGIAMMLILLTYTLKTAGASIWFALKNIFNLATISWISSVFVKSLSFGGAEILVLASKFLTYISIYILLVGVLTVFTRGKHEKDILIEITTLTKKLRSFLHR